MSNRFDFENFIKLLRIMTLNYYQWLMVATFYVNMYISSEKLQLLTGV